MIVAKVRKKTLDGHDNLVRMLKRIVAGTFSANRLSTLSIVR